MDHNQKTYGLLGRKLGHSFSRRFFADKFRRENIDARYLNFELGDISSVRNLVASDPSLSGLNVTIPYKETVIPYLDSLSETARRVGAVNTIIIDRKSDGEISLCGDNTDITGFRIALKKIILEAGFTPAEAIVLGSGGASKAVVYALAQSGIKSAVVSRMPRAGQTGYDSIDPGTVDRCGLVVNTTPCGMWPDTETAPPFPYPLLSGRPHICFDLVYNPEVTRFMELCAAEGAVVSNGLEMLRQQAVASWRLWNGRT
ncbi:MAG: shikimate dehydrogenase [Clostridium sp.]|nr:shikimate dehydrogenase [Clostridium sp.]